MPTQTIDPRAEQIGALAQSDDQGPITMLNLLRFKDRADGIDADRGLTGRQAYEIYGQAVGSHLERAGATVTFLAEGRETVIGPESERWDLILLVSYPSRQAFLQMISDPDYQVSHGHRAAALQDSRLVCCVAPGAPAA